MRHDVNGDMSQLSQPTDSRSTQGLGAYFDNPSGTPLVCLEVYMVC